MMDFVVQHKLMDKVRNLWLGPVFNFSQHFVCRHCYPSGPSEWAFPVRWVEGSSSILWPAVRHDTIEGHTFFLPRTDDVCLAKLFVPLLELDRWEAWEFEWQSPARQAFEFGGALAKAQLPHSIRAVCVGGPTSLKKVIVGNGFWDLPLSFIVEFAAYLAIPLTDRNDEPGVLDAVCRRVLDCDDAQMLAIFERRLGAMTRGEGDAMVHNELLQSDEVQVVLDKADKKSLQSHNEGHEKVSATRAFAGVIRARRDRVQATQAQAQPGKQKARAKSAPAPSARRIPEGPLTQSEAKLMLPHGSFIWRSTASNAWCSRHPPLKQISRAWLAYGHREAAVACIREMLRQHRALGFQSPCMYTRGWISPQTSAIRGRALPIRPLQGGTNMFACMAAHCRQLLESRSEAPSPMRRSLSSHAAHGEWRPHGMGPQRLVDGAWREGAHWGLAASPEPRGEAVGGRRKCARSRAGAIPVHMA